MAERVEIVGPYGERGSVDAADIPAVLEQHGRVATEAELREEQFGGSGAAGAFALGALDAATMGGFTAGAAQVGKWTGNREGVEEAIRGLKETNPIANALGTAVPLVAAPEIGAEEAIANLLPKASSGLGKAAAWAVPKLVTGTGEMAWIEGSQGVSEDLLDHDLAAESFYTHALKPETLYGGLLNVGIAGGFKTLGKLTGLGKAGEAAAADAKSIDDIVQAVQEGGGTSQEASAAIRKVQEMANQRAQLPVGKRAALDGPVESYIKAQAKGDEAVARRLTRHYRDGKNALDALDQELTGYAQKADGHLTSLINDLSSLEDARLGLKHQAIRQAADPATIVQASDAANRWVRELRAVLDKPAMPPAPPPLESYTKKVLSEWKRQGVKPPTDPAALESFTSRAQDFAAASHASDLVAYEEQVAKLMADREALVDPEIRRLFGDPATRVGFSTKDQGKLLSLLNDVQREVAAGRKVGGQEGMARIFTAVDDSRAIVGHMASFGKLTSDAAKMLERHIYNNRLRPLLEDSNIWGSKLADLQAANNEAVSHSIQAIGEVKRSFFGSLDSIDGQKVFVPKGRTKSFIEGLGHPDGSSEFTEAAVRRVTESARARGAAMLKTMDLPPQVRATIARAQKAAGELDSLLDTAKTAATDAREIRGLKAREGLHGMHGVLGTLATGAVDLVTNPTKTLEWLGKFRKAEGAVRGLFSKESKGFLKGEAVPNVKPMLGEAEKKAAIQSIADVQKYQTDSRYLAVSIKNVLGDMVHSTPKLASAVAMTIARGALALAKRAPQPLPPRFTDPPGEARYANGALERYWRDKQLVERPPVVMQLMRSGQLHQEDIGLMQEVVPRLFAQMQLQLELDMMAEREQGKLRGMSYQEQISLAWMLGRPLDPTMEPGFISAMQQSAAEDPMNQAAIGKSAMGGGRPSKLENIDLERYSTLEEKLEA